MVTSDKRKSDEGEVEGKPEKYTEAEQPFQEALVHAEAMEDNELIDSKNSLKIEKSTFSVGEETDE